ncbi:MAG: hypothetical protein OXU36_19985 [Candidatus Poribacteria bacterium]|nr:hypothetical protein [Candidatus Poribacteria bacterium]
MSIDKDRKRLAQKHNLEWIRRDLKATKMVIVYRWDQWVEKKRHTDYFILSELVPQDQIEQVLSEARIGDRYGTENEMEPLIICRSFGGIREDYNEISEEFRLFHNLYHDRKTDTYIKIDDAGNETTVVIVKPGEVQIRLKEIRQFLAIKEMYLSLLFEFNEYSEYSLEELGHSEFEQYDFRRKEAMCWTYDRWDIPVQNFQSISRLRGRKLIEPLPKSKSGFGDFAEEPKYVEFIVDIDDNGDEVYHTCDPYKMRELLGENADAASKYTVVHFRKQVLDKYYNEPSKYTVEDSMVGCPSLWNIKIDNHDPDKVCVFLGELGILPYTEQCHWGQPQYNIPPEGGISETF